MRKRSVPRSPEGRVKTLRDGCCDRLGFLISSQRDRFTASKIRVKCDYEIQPFPIVGISKYNFGHIEVFDVLEQGDFSCKQLFVPGLACLQAVVGTSARLLANKICRQLLMSGLVCLQTIKGVKACLLVASGGAWQRRS